MKTSAILNQPQVGELGLRLPQLRSFFTIGPSILAASSLILGGFLGLILFNQGSNPSPGLVPLPTSTPTAEDLISGSTRNRLASTRGPVPHYSLNFISTNSPTIMPSPTATISPTTPIPSEIMIEGISGRRQSMPLSCEARSAVDWAAYFGKPIDEYSFFDGLPLHDNPDKGFVGNVYGSWGQIPPSDYGVHAKPIAQRLREFGLNAKAVRGMTYQELKAEIASGQPVIVWVVGHVNRGTPVPYTLPGGESTTVTKFEHTVIVIGYTEDKVTVVDGAKVYSRYRGEFMKSWNVLENQAVIWID